MVDFPVVRKLPEASAVGKCQSWPAPKSQNISISCAPAGGAVQPACKQTSIRGKRRRSDPGACSSMALGSRIFVLNSKQMR